MGEAILLNGAKCSFGFCVTSKSHNCYDCLDDPSPDFKTRLEPGYNSIPISLFPIDVQRQPRRARKRLVPKRRGVYHTSYDNIRPIRDLQGARLRHSAFSSPSRLYIRLLNRTLRYSVVYATPLSLERMLQNLHSLADPKYILELHASHSFFTIICPSRKYDTQLCDADNISRH
jgi:hypothetical protein